MHEASELAMAIRDTAFPEVMLVPMQEEEDEVHEPT
jgi:hypothetical protein